MGLYYIVNAVKKVRLEYSFVFCIMFGATLYRLAPHPYNFSPIISMALFFGAIGPNKKIAYLAPLMSMLLSDLILGLYSSIFFTYASLILITSIGIFLRERMNIFAITLATFICACVFFTISNFGVWILSGLYPLAFTGLYACYSAALPFFAHSLIADFVFSALFFSCYYLVRLSCNSSKNDVIHSC